MPQNGNHYRVLIADDENSIADTLALIFKNFGFSAVAVYSGESAVEQAPILQPHILISDVVMKGMSGVDAAIRIRSLLPDCKILLFSGQATTASLLETAARQGQRFELLPKPVHPRVLLERVNQLILQLTQ